MRLAIVSDIHGNLDALQAVLADLQGQSPDLVVNLGDCLSGPLWPVETCDLLMNLKWPTVRGNHDRWLTVPLDPPGPWEATALPLLTSAHLAWLSALPPTLAIDDIFFCHATPQDDLTYWLHRPTPEGEMIRADLSAIAARTQGLPHTLFLCGHTHLPAALRLPDGRMVLNPGSVGGPGFTDDNPIPHRVCAATTHAAYAVLDRGPQGWSVTQRLVAYDTARAVAKAGQDRDWAMALETGWVDLPLA